MRSSTRSTSWSVTLRMRFSTASPLYSPSVTSGLTSTSALNVSGLPSPKSTMSIWARDTGRCRLLGGLAVRLRHQLLDGFLQQRVLAQVHLDDFAGRPASAEARNAQVAHDPTVRPVNGLFHSFGLNFNFQDDTGRMIGQPFDSRFHAKCPPRQQTPNIFSVSQSWVKLEAEFTLAIIP